MSALTHICYAFISASLIFVLLIILLSPPNRHASLLPFSSFVSLLQPNKQFSCIQRALRVLCLYARHHLLRNVRVLALQRAKTDARRALLTRARTTVNATPRRARIVVFIAFGLLIIVPAAPDAALLAEHAWRGDIH